MSCVLCVVQTTWHMCVDTIVRERLRRSRTRAHPPRLDHTAEASMWVDVVSVYDGDTITVVTVPISYANSIWRCCAPLNTFKVRLAGFDAPEMKPRLNVADREQEIEKAHVAKARMEELVLNKCVYLHVTGRDKYGRLLGSFDVGGLPIADVMIQEGHARPYDGGKKDTSSWATKK